LPGFLQLQGMAVARSADKVVMLWSKLNANFANQRMTRIKPKSCRVICLFAAFVLRTFWLCASRELQGMVFPKSLDKNLCGYTE